MAKILYSFFAGSYSSDWKTLKSNVKPTASKFRWGTHACHLRPGLIQANKSLQKTTALYSVNNGLFVGTEEAIL